MIRMEEKDLAAQLPEEPSYWQRVNSRHEEEYGKLSPTLRDLAELVDTLEEYYDSGYGDTNRRITTDRHHCVLPEVKPEANVAFSHIIHHKCECGLEWVYHWTSRCWHLKKDHRP